MKRLFIIVSAMLLAFSSNAGAQQVEQLPNDPAVRKGTLENGMTYYIMHNANPEGRAEFYLATNVGAIQETDLHIFLSICASTAPRISLRKAF